MRNALKTQPRCTLSRWNSRLIWGPAMEMLVRSRKAMALRTNKQQTSTARIGGLPILEEDSVAGIAGAIVRPSACCFGKMIVTFSR